MLNKTNKKKYSLLNLSIDQETNIPATTITALSNIIAKAIPSIPIW